MRAERLTEIQKIVVRVDEVDLANRIAHCFDKHNVLIQVSFRDAPGGLFHIPNQGERWTIQRIGISQWNLVQRLDSTDEHDWVVGNLTPGDTRLAADGALHLRTDTAYMNGRGIGSTVKDNFYSAAAWTSVTLSTLPASDESIHPMLNGLLITPDLYSVSGRVLRFITTMAAGNLTISYQVWQEALDDAFAVIGKAVVSGVDVYTP